MLKTMERISVNFYARRFYFQVMCNPFNSSCPLYTGRCTKKRVDYVAASLILDMVNSFVLFKPATFKKIRSVFHDDSKIPWYSGGKSVRYASTYPFAVVSQRDNRKISKCTYVYTYSKKNRIINHKNIKVFTTRVILKGARKSIVRAYKKRRKKK